MTITLLPAQLVALTGGVLIVVSAWLDWIRPSRPCGPAMGLSAFDVPAQFLVRNRGLFISRTGPSLGVLVFVLGAACLVGALVAPCVCSRCRAGPARWSSRSGSRSGYATSAPAHSATYWESALWWR